MTSIGSIVYPPEYVTERDLNASLLEFQQVYANGQPIRYLMMSPWTTSLLVLIPSKIVGYDEDGDPVFALSTRLGLMMVVTDPTMAPQIIDVHVGDC